MIGKEGNKLEERLSGEVLEQADFQTSYGRRVDPWEQLVLPVLKQIGARTLAELTGFKIRSIYDVLGKGAHPHARRRTKYEDAAVAHASAQLREWNEEVPETRLAILRRYLDEHERRTSAAYTGDS